MILLDLGNNKIASVKALRPLCSLPLLRNLNVRGNPLCEEEGWEEAVMAMLPQVRVLNGNKVRSG